MQLKAGEKVGTNIYYKKDPPSFNKYNFWRFLLVLTPYFEYVAFLWHHYILYPEQN